MGHFLGLIAVKKSHAVPYGSNRRSVAGITLVITIGQKTERKPKISSLYPSHYDGPKMPDLQIIQIFLVITRPLPTLPKIQKMAKSRKLITLAITRSGGSDMIRRVTLQTPVL